MNPTTSALAWAIANYYDMQKLRLAAGSRSHDKTSIKLDPVDQALLARITAGLKALEDEAATHIGAVIAQHPMWPWLSDIRGVGPILAGVLVSQIDPTKARYASSVWQFCGLGVDGGAAPRRIKGQKSSYNHWLRTKLCGTLGPSMLKTGLRKNDPQDLTPPHKRWVRWGVTNSYTPVAKKDVEDLRQQGILIEHTTTTQKKKTIEIYYQVTPQAAWTHPDDPYVPIYLNRKHRAETSGWGNSHGHRHQHAIRVMLKMFLLDFWRQWRTQLGLPTPDPYREGVLGLPPHGTRGLPAN